MKIKRYVDKNMRRVLRQVREEQGPDAVILSNRRIRDDIEVIAAVDYDQALMQRALQAAMPGEAAAKPDESGAVDEGASEAAAANGGPATPAEAAGPRVVAAKLERRPVAVDARETRPRRRAPATVGKDDRLISLDSIRSEISSMRSMLENQLSTLNWKNQARQQPWRAEVLRNLTKIGIAPDVCNLVTDRLGPIDKPRELWRKPLHALAGLLPLKGTPLLETGGVAALIGPAGVGKTTTIAKIASQFALQHGTDGIALISADAHRLGAQEQLATFAGILGVKVYRADDIDTAQALLGRLRDKKLVLIDTEGTSQRDRDLTERLAAYGRNDERIRYYLTLSATCQEAGLDETIRVFSRVPLEAAVITKIDEAAQLGCVLSTLVRHDLAAAFLCDGQRIPDDLHLAEKKRLWLINQAMECMRASSVKVDDDTMIRRFGYAGAVHA